MRVTAIRPYGVNYNQTSFQGIFKKKKEAIEGEQGEQNTDKKGKGLLPVVGVASVAGLGAAVAIVATSPKVVIVPYNSGVTDIQEISEVFDVDDRTLYVDSDSQTLQIFTKYDYLEKIIERERRTLYLLAQDDVKGYKQFNYVDGLIEKQEYQKQIAAVYTDGKYIYFDVLPDNYDSSISVERFKRVFDIKDGVLSEIPENNIAFDITIGEFYKGDNTNLTSGITLKIPRSGIDKYNIDFNYN